MSSKDPKTMLACYESIKELSQKIANEVAEHGLDVDEFFFCLGGTMNQYIQRLAEKVHKPELADSFLEGFSSYSRFSKSNSDISTDQIFWLIGNGNPN